MRLLLAALGIAVPALASAAHADSPPRRRPGPTACPNLPRDPRMGEVRTAPLPIPQGFSHIARSTRDHIAVQTLSGGTFCLDAREILQADRFASSADGRFFSFRWAGYEADGYIVVDRSGRGQQVETGVPPAFSPSGSRFAAIQVSEAAFGGLEGFAVWGLRPAGLDRLTFIQNLPRMEDWRIDGWAGETCINLSARPFAGRATAARARFVARPGPHGWTIARAARGCGDR